MPADAVSRNRIMIGIGKFIIGRRAIIRVTTPAFYNLWPHLSSMDHFPANIWKRLPRHLKPMRSRNKSAPIESKRTPGNAEIVINAAFFEYSEKKSRLTIVSSDRVVVASSAVFQYTPWPPKVHPPLLCRIQCFLRLLLAS